MTVRHLSTNLHTLQERDTAKTVIRKVNEHSTDCHFKSTQQQFHDAKN